RDLVLDEVRRASFPFGVNDHLYIAQIGNRIERRMHQAIESRGHSEDREDEDEEFVSGAGLDNPFGERLALWNLRGSFCRNRFRFGHGFVPGARRSPNGLSRPAPETNSSSSSSR